MTSLNAEELEEGDCRYLPKEILSDDHSHLSKADVFALGLIIYQAVSSKQSIQIENPLKSLISKKMAGFYPRRLIKQTLSLKWHRFLNLSTYWSNKVIPTMLFFPKINEQLCCLLSHFWACLIYRLH